jgi:hypothetical protein
MLSPVNGWNVDHRRHGKLPGQPVDEQVAADAVVMKWR